MKNHIEDMYGPNYKINENLQNKPRPWLRFMARYIDIFLHMIVVVVVWMLIDEESLEKFNDTAFSILFMVVWSFIEGAYIAIWGTTPGKKIFKIKLTRIDGQPLKTYQAFKRSRLVLFRGMGIGITIILIIANILAYKKIKKYGITTWDSEAKVLVSYEPLGATRISLITVVILGILALIVFGVISEIKDINDFS